MIAGILKESGAENRVALLPGEAAGLKKLGVEVIFPSKKLCTDNAAMVAGFAYHLHQNGVVASLDLNPQSAILPRGANPRIVTQSRVVMKGAYEKK